MRYIYIKYLAPMFLSATSCVCFAQSYQCTVDVSSICSQAGCNMSSNTIRIDINDNNTVNRCDSKGCDEIIVESVISGAMRKYGSIYNGYLLVLNTMANTFTEVATLADTAFIKSGTCK